MDKYAKLELAETLAKEKYDLNFMAGLWGCAKVLLSEQDIDVIVRVMEKA